MHYHSNHFTCHNSNWDNEPFETAEVCVTIRNDLFLFSNIKNNIKNPDFDLLLEEKEINNEKDKMKDMIDTLKPNVLEWLNENIKDKKDVLEDINGEEIIIF